MAQAGPVSTFTCPNGHASTSSDYCDTCGVPIPAGAAGPRCRSPRSVPPRRGRDPDRPPPPPRLRARRARPPAGVPQLRLARRRRGAVLRGLRLRLHDRLAAATRPTPRPTPRGDPGRHARRRHRCGPAPLAPAIAVDWVAEVWVDPDWYEAQESDDPCPSPGLPAVVELAAKSVLIGRPSDEPQHPSRDRLHR